MDDLVAFCRARIAEERADAEAAHPGPWDADRCRIESNGSDDNYMVIYDEGGHTEEDAAHIARQDPAAALARCDALTALVDWAVVSIGSQDNGDPAAGTETAMAEAALRHVSAIWRDHADYRPAWAA